jgi:hypothetical protein
MHDLPRCTQTLIRNEPVSHANYGGLSPAKLADELGVARRQPNRLATVP